MGKSQDKPEECTADLGDQLIYMDNDHKIMNLILHYK